jgi:hypothetical protein
MELKHLLTKIDDAANMWHKTKDEYYKTLWYQLIRKYSKGIEKDPRPSKASR